uniref:Haloacid dehalogenase n=1 Tax=Thermosporothrix sp. COM3 TaxID=2490863 RepID=A0A455SLL8_9CHLR|nr:hypothetical protein KTC_25630 [Thermosporothrix sp. COM3]
MIKAAILDLDALVQKGSAIPLPGIPERLASFSAQRIPLAIISNQNTLIERTAEQRAFSPDGVSVPARVAANIKEITQELGLYGVPWFISLGDANARRRMSDAQYQGLIEQIAFELGSFFPEGALFVSQVIGPAPALFLTIAQHLQVAPSECLYLGVGEKEREAAEAAGMTCELVPAIEVAAFEATFGTFEATL